MFVVCGEALWDLFAAQDPPLRFDARTGGSPFNVAIGLARLGQRSALLTGLSTDMLGRRLADALEAEQVSTRYLVRSTRPTTISLVDLGADGQPAYAFYGEAAADRALAEDDLPELGTEVWGLHAGSYSLAVEPVGSSLLALFAREARRRLLTLDPNVRLGVEPDASRWRRRIDAFARHADMVKASEEDLDRLYPGADAAAIAERWRRAGAGLVIVTRGAAGAAAFCPCGRVEVPAREVAVADTVGAGDAFQAALIAGLAARGVRDRAGLDALGREAVAGLLDFACAAAAMACTRRGADLPRRAELPWPSLEVS